MSLDPMPSNDELLRRKAEREARRSGHVGYLTPFLNALSDKPTPSVVPLMISWPIRLVLPWSLLVSDNDKYGVIEGRMLLTSRYREAKAAIKVRARDLLAGADPAVHPVALVAVVWVPDNRPHDVPNFGKCVHDALEGVVYVKDRWLYEAHWKRAGVDVDAPRAEIVITPMVGAA